MMFKRALQKTYYFSDNQLRIREIKWFRLKVVSTILTVAACSIALLIAVNKLYYNFMGLGDNRLTTLMRENSALRTQLDDVTSEVGALQSTLEKLARQGDQLRLMVDLQTLDTSAAIAGMGGAISEGESSFLGDTSGRILGNTMHLLQHLAGEIKVQEQSYQQIIGRYEFNKGYFAALPALKPMEGYYSAKDFGLRMHPVLGVLRVHEGLDIVNDVGTPVYAAGDGIIEMAGHTGGGFGVEVVIKHGYGFQTLYAHLDKALVREGQRVKRGDLIGKSGRSGLVSGPHLHYEVRYNGVCQNPMDYFLDDINPRQYHDKLTGR